MTEYDFIDDTDNKFRRVRVGDKWGFIDGDNREIVPLKYDFVYCFINGFSQVLLNGRWGLIDKSGKEITEIKYDSLYSLEDGLSFFVLNNRSGFIDTDGNEYLFVNEIIDINNKGDSLYFAKYKDTYVLRLQPYRLCTLDNFQKRINNYTQDSEYIEKLKKISDKLSLL